MSTAGSPASLSLWKEYKNQDGRAYWFHTAEKRSVWEKPDELKTPREKAIAQTRWREYKSGERSYYVHSETKQTTWQMPQELKNALAQVPSDATRQAVQDAPSPHPKDQGNTFPAPSSAAPAVSKAGSSSASPAPAPGPAPGPPPITPAGLIPGGPPRPIYSGPPPGFGPPGPPPVVPVGAGSPPTMPTMARPPVGSAGLQGSGGQSPSLPLNAAAMASPHEAFKHLLRSKGVTKAWTWEQTMRQIVTEPLYKTLKSLSERKAVFADYQADLRKEEEKERTKKRLAVKLPVIELLKRVSSGTGKLKPYASWKTVMKLYGQETAIKDAIEDVGEDDVRPFWDEVKKEIKANEEASARQMRHRNMDLLMSLLRTFEADVTTRWRDAHRTVLESYEWKQDAHLSSMDLSDMIIVFEEYVRDIERQETERRRIEDKQQAREERRRRTVFRQLLEQGRQEGWIHSKVSWPEVYRRLQGDQRLEGMLAQRGSSPLDLFFDAVDLCDRSVEARTASVEALIKMAEPQWEGIKEVTTWAEFTEKIRSSLERAAPLMQSNGAADLAASEANQWKIVAKEDAELKIVFENLQEAAVRTAKEARKRHERRVRHLIDDARYGLKKDISDDLLREAEALVAWDDAIQARLEKIGIWEWKRLDEEIADERERAEVKKITWEKFSRRQKEKAEERLATEAASRKRKSDMASSEAAHEERERERERARRREDRDRRRGGRDERDRDGDPGRRRSKDYGDDVRQEYTHLKRRRSEASTLPTPVSKAPAPVSTASVSATGGGGGDDDNDKEEGEV